MYITLSKRFEFATSYRLFRDDRSGAENRALYGDVGGGAYGFGSNFVACFVFHGPVDAVSGMIVNISVIKRRINELLAKRYDHKFLNGDTPPFDRLAPTPEHIAGELMREATPLFDDLPATLVAVNLAESDNNEATAYADGRVERHRSIEFSAARRTYSPHLSNEENSALFGIAAEPGGHGHHYRVRATVRGEVNRATGLIVPESDMSSAMEGVYEMLDHRNLVTDVPELNGIPLTTECLTRFVYEQLAAKVPLAAVRMWENPYFSCEYCSEGRFGMNLQTSFQAAHRLHSGQLTDQENIELYEKCNNPKGHGHRYRVEVGIGGPLDEKSGALFPLDRLQAGMKEALNPWAYKHLDLETDDFDDRPSTSENIIQLLWPRVNDRVDGRMYRLRLWETTNNRFTLRREPLLTSGDD